MLHLPHDVRDLMFQQRAAGPKRLPQHSDCCLSALVAQRKQRTVPLQACMHNRGRATDTTGRQDGVSVAAVVPREKNSACTDTTHTTTAQLGKHTDSSKLRQPAHPTGRAAIHSPGAYLPQTWAVQGLAGSCAAPQLVCWTAVLAWDQHCSTATPPLRPLRLLLLPLRPLPRPRLLPVFPASTGGGPAPAGMFLQPPGSCLRCAAAAPQGNLVLRWHPAPLLLHGAPCSEEPSTAQRSGCIDLSTILCDA